MNHHLISSHSIESLITEIDLSIKNNFIPTLAFIYVSIDYDIKSLVKSLKKYTFIVVGSSTSGEIYADQEMGVHTQEKSLVCMLVDMDALAFSIKLKKNGDNDSFKLGKKIGKWTKKTFENGALLTITSGLNFDNDNYLKGIQERQEDVFGAIAATNEKEFDNTYVFSNTKIVKEGVLALAINKDKIEIVTSLGFGWSGIGIQRVVTKSHKNIVYTIDDKPAIEFYTEYLDITSKDMPTMGIEFPMEVMSKEDEVVTRAVLDIHSDGSLRCAGHIKEGSRVKISIPIGLKIIDNIVENIEQSLYNSSIGSPDFTLLFPCKAHKDLFGCLATTEIEAVFNTTKNRPLIGFYAYGEISSALLSFSSFYNESFLTIQFKEK